MPRVRIAVARETREGETRVAMVPELVGKLTALGYEVAVEPGAGLGSLHDDQEYVDAGAVVTESALEGATLVVSVSPLDTATVRRLDEGTATMSFLPVNQSLDLVADLRDCGLTSFAMELVPRISRAQSMDALSSQALVAGYRCAIVAAGMLRRFFPLNMTAAGTVPPAEVVVLGAGGEREIEPEPAALAGRALHLQSAAHGGDGLIDDLVLGRVVELSDLPGVEVPAAVIRRACMQDPPPGASCITLNGATIIGDLDLSHLVISRSLSLRACTLRGDLGLADVRAATVSLCGCTVDGTLTADHGSIGRLDLSGSTITGSVSMRGATIEHELAMVGVAVGGDHNGNSVVADDLRVGGSALLSGGIDATIPDAASAVTSSYAGAVRLTRASVNGNVEFVGANLGGETGRTNALGCSLVVDPNGAVIAEAGAEPAELSATLTRAVLAEARSTNPSLANRVR